MLFLKSDWVYCSRFVHLEGVMYQFVLLALCGASLVAAEQGSVAALVREEVVSIESEVMVAEDLLVQDLIQDLTEDESFSDEEIDTID